MPRPFRGMVSDIEAVTVALALLRASASAGSVVSAHLWLEDPNTSTLRLITSAGREGSSDPVPLTDDPLGRALTQGTALLKTIVDTRSGQPLWRFVLPLTAGETRGVAAVDFASPHQPHAETLIEITSRLSGALAGSLALHVSRTETRTARALLNVTRELSRSLDPADVVSLTLKRAIEMSGAATGSIMLVDSETGKLRIAEHKGLSPEVVASTAVSEGEGIAGWVLATKRPMLVEDLPPSAGNGKRTGVRSAVSVPIADEDGVLGVLNVGTESFPARLTSTQMQALGALGAQAAVALRNATALSSARELYFATLRALALAMETKDPYSHGNTEQVARLAVALGQRLGLDEGESQALEIAALLHDIGMEAAGELPVTSVRPLSTVERGLIKMHPVIAVEILSEVPALAEVVPIVYHHHEWYDGRGYVGGLSGESIPLGSRILAVVDAYVAMTSDRPHRPAMPRSEAVSELRHGAGSQFDPVVVEVFIELLEAQASVATEATQAS